MVLILLFFFLQSPDGKHFATAAGYMPEAMVQVFKRNGTLVRFTALSASFRQILPRLFSALQSADILAGPYNWLRWAPGGRLLAMHGTGNVRAPLQYARHLGRCYLCADLMLQIRLSSRLLASPIMLVPFVRRAFAAAHFLDLRVWEPFALRCLANYPLEATHVQWAPSGLHFVSSICRSAWT
jgi:hypothetical protein